MRRVPARFLPVALAALAVPALAQVAAPRTLTKLKAEVQERADRHAYPVSELDPAEVREALAVLKSLDRDEWAAAWSAIGDRHLAQGKALEASNHAGASKHYKYAFEYYLFARFPLENSPGKVKAYDKALEAFAAYAKIRSEEHTSELQSRSDLVCRLLLEKKRNCRRSRWASRRRCSSP